MPTPAPAPSDPRRSRDTISVYVVAALCRLLLNTARRFPYPFAPALSRGLDVPLTAVTSMIAANQASGLLAAAAGPWGDRLGYRTMMMTGLGLLTAGMLLGGAVPLYPAVLAALFLAGLGKSLFDPAIQAYVGARVPYHRRGLVVGLIEMSWAGSTLVGIPLVGLLIERQGWRAPFFALAALGFAGLVAVWRTAAPSSAAIPRTAGPRWFLAAWSELFHNRAAAGILAYVLLTSIANDSLFVVYGAWLEKTFGLGVAGIGLLTGIIGAAELVGELLTVALADRLGKRRAIVAGLLLAFGGYALLPLWSASLGWALAGLGSIFLAVEFTIVTSLSLATEVLPALRATMMAAYLAAAGVGRVIGALLGGPVWTAAGITGTAVVSGGATLLALACLLTALRGRRRW
jgi:DHA1 family inner membrane transport protein